MLSRLHSIILHVLAAGTVAFLGSCGSDASEPASGGESDTASSAPDVPSEPSETTGTPEVGEPVVNPEPPAGPCALNSRVGRFQLAHFDKFSGLVGSVSHGVIPLTVLQPVAEAGDCVLLRKENPFCDPPCAAGDLCDHDGTCIAYPATANVGTLQIGGLSEPLSIEPFPNNDYAHTELAADAWTPGDWLTLVAPGGDLPGFELTAQGVALLEAPEGKWHIDQGEPLVVTWTPAPGPGRIRLSLNVDQHGTTPSTLFCDTEDTGELTVATPLIDAFLALGVSGFAVGRLERRSVDSIPLDAGCVELSVQTEWIAAPVVGGHTPCNATEDCPEGQTCSVFINTCVDP